MNKLDDAQNLAKCDQHQMTQSIADLPFQIEQGWQEALSVKLPKNHSHISSIIVCGMGGSNLASELARAVFGREIKVPFVLVRGYDLPVFADKNSLIIISSYSGGTDEPVSCLKQATLRKLKVLCLAGGGKVIAMAKANKLPYYQINKKYNLSGQPRYGVGSQLGALLALLKSAGVIKLSAGEMTRAVESLEVLGGLFDTDRATTQNPAKCHASWLSGGLPILVGAEFLSANGHIIANQINESAKNFAVPFVIPELNHHLMEGLLLPSAVTSRIRFVFFNSSLYHSENKKRFAITQQVLRRQQIKYMEYTINGSSRLEAALEILLFGSWLSFYLTVINEQNPTDIKWVDYFKAELKK